MTVASDRLARSRLAIVEHVHRKEGRSGRPQAMRERGEHEEGDQWEAAQAAAASGSGGWFTRIQRAARSYWRHHPARVGVQMATPLLSAYARRNPAAYIGIAAVAGAILMVARPWRLVSATGVLVALAKSPQLAGVVMSAMSGADFDDEYR
ncbi:MAG TPA: hypothetical protein VMZ74_10710 [Ramlibacter sp.]|nr:hypothetical protein [Ramlibacter sp.]